LQADWIGGLEIVPTVATAGIFVGLILAKSKFSDRTAHLFSIVYGAFILAYFIGLALPGDLMWRERVFDIVGRQALWIRQAIDGTTNRDGLIFVMHTSLVFWLLGYTAAWYTFREQRIWRVVLPTGMVLLSVVYYYYGPKPLFVYLGIFAIFALLYISQTYLVDQERLWQQSSVRYEQSLMRFNFIWSSLLAGLLAMTIAWSLPALTANAAISDAVNDVSQPWRDFQDNWTRLFSSLRSYGTGSNDPYGSNLTLGGPRNVGDTLIMDVFVEEELPYVYWQAIAFDTYNGTNWEATDTDQVIHFPDDGFFDVPKTEARQVISQTVVNYVPNAGTIYGAPEIVTSDKQMFVNRRLDNNGRELVSSVKSRFQLQQGDSYEVTSQVSNADATSLREAGINYPDWVNSTYLQLPDTITPETKELAQRFGDAYSNPFDMSIAIRDYLRTNITYNDQIAAPPQGVDAVHYVLFDLQEGYCNYYASAMSVLLRLNGIPARVVAGYAQGEFLEDDNFYRVRAQNAHTWVEVYFPEYGWIQFEPTASIPLVERPETAGGGDAFGEESANFDSPQTEDDGLIDDNAPGGEQDLSDDSVVDVNLDEPRFDTATILRAVFGVLIVAAAGGVMFAANLWNRQVEGDVEKSYGRLDSWANWLGLTLTPTHTPYERATLMSWAVPDGRAPIRNLTQQFVLKEFSAAQMSDPDFDSRSEWKVLRPILWKTTAVRWVDSLRSRNRDTRPDNIEALRNQEK
jgi:transglutaminase-like putative cysteine protease